MNELPKTPLTDEDYERFEEPIPALAERATREAYERALQSGLPVTILVGNSIVQITASQHLANSINSRHRTSGGPTLQ